MKEPIENKLKKALVECEKHISRMEFAADKISHLMPLNVKKYKNLTNEDIAFIDQFLYRFSKLQDTIGQKLFRYILLYLEEDIESKPFIDILNRLEKLKIIESVNEWKRLREYKNELSHNYEDDPDVAVALINSLFENKDKLKTIYSHIKNTMR